MKKILLLISLPLLLLSCGVSSSDKKQMETVLSNYLYEKYSNSDIIPGEYTVELSNVKKDKYIYDGEYWGVFSCTFKDGDNNVIISGTVSFDNYINIVRLKESYGKGKLAIDISTIVVNNKIVKDVNHSKYVLDCFANRNNYSK